MSLPLKIIIKESISELRAHLRKSGELIGKRLRVLIEIKRHEESGISKRALSKLTGANHNSIDKWRKMYLAGGISAILTHDRKGHSRSLFSALEHKQLSNLLKNPKNGIVGYTELLVWVKRNLGKVVSYQSLRNYCKKHFDTKIKTARKSHIKKDEVAVENLKKTSLNS